MVTFNRNQGIYLTALCLSFCLLSCGRKSSRVSQQPALDNKKNVGLLESKDTNIKKKLYNYFII